MNILTVCGSLCAASINAALLRTAQHVAPPHLRVVACACVATLPLFNPDLESAPPAAVGSLYVQVADADAMLIASPE